jgi:N-acetyl-alpha-D-muramate 1-phosphate uridylyltransferase
MLLAAGRGERLRPLTDDVPKALVEVNGSSLLERHLQRLATMDVDTVVINTGWLGDKIVARCGGGSRFGLQIVYSPEYDNVLETGGGIVRALPLFGEQPFWVINADIVTDWALPAAAMPDSALAHVVLVPNPAYRANGDFDLVAGRVRNGAVAPYTYSGIACYSPAFFRGHGSGRFSVAPLLQAAADEGTLSGEIHEGLWADVGTPERLAAVSELLRNQASARA